MKKILFNDRYGLTQAVLDGRKTMTRRIVPQSAVDYYLTEAEDPTLIDAARYDVGEVVAVAQPYKDLDYKLYGYATNPDMTCGIKREYAEKQAGWSNKMFVSAKYMPNQIQITDIHVERLQDITDDDCLKEGVWIDSHREILSDDIYTVDVMGKHYCQWHFTSPREAFAALIDKVSGNGTWVSNPYVFAYSFQLLK